MPLWEWRWHDRLPTVQAKGAPAAPPRARAPLAAPRRLKVHPSTWRPEVPVGNGAHFSRSLCTVPLLPTTIPYAYSAHSLLPTAAAYLPLASNGTDRSYMIPAASSSRLTTSTSLGALSLLLPLSAFTSVAPAGSLATCT